jgi:hypothetical protein
MKSSLQKAFKITLAALFGAMLSAIGSGAWWYFISYNYYVSNNGIINFSREGAAAIGAVFGAFFGVVGGAITGIMVGSCNLSKGLAAITGFLINGLFTVIVFIALGDGKIFTAPKIFWLSLSSQFFVGGVTGSIVALLFNNTFRRKMEIANN